MFTYVLVLRACMHLHGLCHDFCLVATISGNKLNSPNPSSFFFFCMLLLATLILLRWQMDHYQRRRHGCCSAGHYTGHVHIVLQSPLLCAQTWCLSHQLFCRLCPLFWNLCWFLYWLMLTPVSRPGCGVGLRTYPHFSHSKDAEDPIVRNTHLIARSAFVLTPTLESLEVLPFPVS